MSKITKWLLLGGLLFNLFSLPSHAYQCLRTTGAGYASILDANQAGLDMGLSDFMVEMRFRTVYSAASQRIVSKREGNVGYELYLFTNGTLKFFIGDSGSLIVKTSDTAGYYDGRWHSVILVANRDGNATFYVDGSSDGGGDISSQSGSLDNASPFVVDIYSADLSSTPFIGWTDEARVWNFGKDGLPAGYATYIAWRAAARNVFLDISNYNSGSWNLYADAVQTDLHDGSGTVAGMTVGMKYSYETATPHTLDYQGGTLADDGVFTATHTTGTIASGDADDHVRRVGLTARWKFEGDYLDEGSNNNDLAAGGSGNTFPGYTLKRQKIISPFSVK